MAVSAQVYREVDVAEQGMNMHTPHRWEQLSVLQWHLRLGLSPLI